MDFRYLCLCKRKKQSRKLFWKNTLNGTQINEREEKYRKLYKCNKGDDFERGKPSSNENRFGV